MQRLISALLLFSLVILTQSLAHSAEPSVVTSVYGRLADGQEVRQFTLTNQQGLQARVIEYGATLTALLVPDREGKLANVLLGADSLEDYVRGFPAASVIGRYANRIRGARFVLDGTEYRVTKNAGEHHIHGGRQNFAKALWRGTTHSTPEAAVVVLQYTSPDGEEGFPGDLQVTVTYSLSNDNALTIRYEAQTDRPTVINLTNHAYFNLAGSDAARQGADVLEHELQLLATKYTAVDQALLPTGEIKLVEGTPLDFLKPHRIGERIEELYEAARGYDHNYIVDGQPGKLRLAARVTEPKSGRVMECRTTEPAVQLYTANGFSGSPFPKHGAFCLETQHYPDSPNHPEFPTTVIRPDQPWSSTTSFGFSNRR